MIVWTAYSHRHRIGECGLRDYGVKGQIGLEPTLNEYLDKLLVITAELKRVLKPTGTLWWNHGDCYGGSWQDYGARNGGQRPKSTDSWQRPGNPSETIPPTARLTAKCLAFQNYRLAIRMIDEQGWIARNDIEAPFARIIWNKPNSMPSSVVDRFANSYEPIFFFAKTNKPQFYVNQKTLLMQREKPPGIKGEEGVDWEWREVGKNNGDSFNVRVRDADTERFMEKVTDDEKANYGKGEMKKVTLWRSVNYYFDLDAVRATPSSVDAHGNRIGGDFGKKSLATGGPTGKPETVNNPAGKNPGDVWTIPTQPRSEAHFATFPDELAARVIQVGCPREVCPKCGLPRVRVSKRGDIASSEDYRGQAVKDYESAKAQNPSDAKRRMLKSMANPPVTIGFSSCSCNVSHQPGITLDPFIGRGTTAIVAQTLLRSYVGIELNPEYVTMALNNIKLATEGQLKTSNNTTPKQGSIL